MYYKLKRKTLNKNIRILLVILVLVSASVIMLTIFTKMQNKRIEKLKKTLDSLESGRLDRLNEKYFNSSQADSGSIRN